MSDTRHPWIDTVRERADIVEVVSEYTTLRRNGRDWRGPCPIHGGKDPNNFRVQQEKGYYRCFSDCSDGGNVFHFLMKLKGISFMEAAKELAAKYGVEIPTTRRYFTEEERERRGDLARYATAAHLWARVGVHTGTEAYRLGAAPADGTGDDRLLLPLWNEAVPLGFLAYTVSALGTPVPSAFVHRDSVEVKRNQLYFPRGFHAEADPGDDTPLLFVEDPVLVVRLAEIGVRNTFSVALPDRTADGAYFSADMAAEALARAKGKSRRIVLLVNADDEDATERGRLLRALFATELSILEAGAEPLLLRLHTKPDAVFGWSWAALRQDPDEVEEHVARAVDVFEMRTGMLAGYRGRLSVDERIRKILPSLMAARKGDMLLFETYVAWAAAALHLDRSLLVARAVPEQEAAGGEIF